MENHHIYLDGHRTNVAAKIHQFDFSAHCGMRELKKLISEVNPKKLILQHGDEDAIDNLALWAEAKDYDVLTPKVGDFFEI